jgi:uncharacterized protein
MDFLYNEYMQFNLDNGDALFKIKTYKNRLITVNEQTYGFPILVTPIHLIAPWGPQNFDDLKPGHFDMILNHHPKLKILILGTGEKLQFPSAHLYAALVNNHIGIEIMDTRAACRTYTVLMAEGRAVAAALLT